MDNEMTEPAREQSRARYPDSCGYINRDGEILYYEVSGSGEPTIFLLPTWSIIHSRHWKMQIPYLARHCRVVTFDGRGNGRSDRTDEDALYAEREFVARSARGSSGRKIRSVSKAPSSSRPPTRRPERRSQTGPSTPGTRSSQPT